MYEPIIWLIRDFRLVNKYKEKELAKKDVNQETLKVLDSICKKVAQSIADLKWEIYFSDFSYKKTMLLEEDFVELSSDGDKTQLKIIFSGKDGQKHINVFTYDDKRLFLNNRLVRDWNLQ